MLALQSRMSGMEFDFAELKERLDRSGFVLGGNWDYRQGCFDKNVDGDKRTVWLRIPFEVVHGRADPEAPERGTRVKLGTPYALRHQYETGDDDTARRRTFGAWMDQFQPPADPDAPLASEELADARRALNDAETLLT